MDTSETNSTTEEEEEEKMASEQRPRTRSNPEGAEDRTLSLQASVGSRSEGEGEAASTTTSPPSSAVQAPNGKTWLAPAPPSEFQVRTPRVNCPEKVLSGFTSEPREVCSCLYDLKTVLCKSF
ncbi:BRISC and BRCA1-A complex member 1-like, partial [Protobothrops mucrosquamatus]|uniref:BRISC and BRCA1-A complex member 1-like n=1 Tax=Protobothrops mucrosquamatus TaxID=103944 RepID=UPI0007759F8C